MGLEALASVVFFLDPGAATIFVPSKNMSCFVALAPCEYISSTKPSLRTAESYVLAMSKNPSAAEAAKAQEIDLELDHDTKIRIERTLTSLGHDCGEIDGVFDDDTRSAIRNFQKEWSFQETGYVDEVTFVRLLAIGIF